MRKKYTVNFEKIAKDIALNHSAIAHDLTLFYDRIENEQNRSGVITKEWGSVENYVDSLYWMKFEKKMNLTQIKEVTGIKNIYRHYQAIGWNYSSFDYDECNKKHEERLTELQKIKRQYDYNSPIFESDKYNDIADKARGKLSKKALVYYPAKNEEDLIRQIYFYLYECELGTIEISRIMDIHQKSVEKLIVLFDMKLSKSEVQKRAAKKRDYGRIEATRRHTVFNASMKDAAFGSHAENAVRSYLAIELENVLENKYEIIVGLNTRTIISPNEIDIPIIFINKKTGAIIKIAVEVDGEKFHSSPERVEIDKKKDSIISEHGWKIVRMPISYNMDVDGNIDEELGIVINEILKYLADDLQEVKSEEITKVCPNCGGELMIRVASRGKRAGNKFWGCRNYPECRYIENIEPDNVCN